MLLEILLMIFLRPVEFRGRPDFRHNLFAEPPRILKPLLGSLRCRLLLRIMEEDDRPVLCAHVRALAVQCRRIVDIPKHVQKLIIRNLGWVVLHLHHFSVPGFP